MNADKKRDIMLHYLNNPVNKKDINDETYIKVNTSISSCIDNIDIYIKIEENIIKDIAFNGEACAVSLSSTSIMIKNLIGKTINEANEYIDNFEKMINEKIYDKNILNEAIVYDEIYKQGSRKKCALLPYEGIKKAINNK